MDRTKRPANPGYREWWDKRLANFVRLYDGVLPQLGRFATFCPSRPVSVVIRTSRPNRVTPLLRMPLFVDMTLARHQPNRRNRVCSVLESLSGRDPWTFRMSVPDQWTAPNRRYFRA